MFLPPPPPVDKSHFLGDELPPIDDLIVCKDGSNTIGWVVTSTELELWILADGESWSSDIKLEKTHSIPSALQNGTISAVVTTPQAWSTSTASAVSCSWSQGEVYEVQWVEKNGTTTTLGYLTQDVTTGAWLSNTPSVGTGISEVPGNSDLVTFSSPGTDGGKIKLVTNTGPISGSFYPCTAIS